MDYIHVVSAFLNTPWAIQREKLATMSQIVCLRIKGENFSADQIRQRVGPPKADASSPYVIDQESGQTFRELVRTDEDGRVVERKSALQVAAASVPAGQKKPTLVAVLPVYGIISHRLSLFEEMCGGTSTETISRQLDAFVNNADVKTILLDFDTPGGSVYGVDELAQKIFDAKSMKKIIAQVNPLCASAGYYLASQAHEVVITPSGECGSIGVWNAHEDVSAMAEKMGVKITLISAGKFKVEGNPYEPLGEEAKAFMQQRVDDYYELFVDAVARGRDVKTAAVRKGFAEGRVVGATEAVALGLCDRIASFEQTVNRLTAKGQSVGASAKAGAVKLELPDDTEDPEDTDEDPEAAGVCACPCEACKAGNCAQCVNPQCDSTMCPHVAGSSNQQVSEIPATAENNTEVVMEQNNANVAAAAAITTAAVERVNAITRLASAHNMTSKLGSWLESGKSVSDIQGEILASLKTSAVPGPSAEQLESQVASFIDAEDRMPKGTMLARLARCVAAGKGDPNRAVRFARETLKSPKAAAALESSTISGGGFLIPEVFSQDFIELLRPMAVLRSLGPTIAPLVNGSLTMPKLIGASAANYIGENQDITANKPKGGNVKWTSKKLGALVAIPNDLIRFAGPVADNMVREDMLRVVALREDLAFIRDKGTQYTPTGLRYQCSAGNLKNASALISTADANYLVKTLQAVRKDLGSLRLALRQANVQFIRPGWIISARTEEFLMNLVDGYGNLVYYKEMTEKGTLRGYPYRVTTQIPENLETGTSTGLETEIYLADFADVVIADVPTIQMEVSTEASYYDGTQLISAFSQDQTVIRLIEEHDLQMRHQESLAVLQQVLWGT